LACLHSARVLLAFVDTSISVTLSLLLRRRFQVANSPVTQSQSKEESTGTFEKCIGLPAVGKSVLI
jgi:hypothetical protein